MVAAISCSSPTASETMPCRGQYRLGMTGESQVLLIPQVQVTSKLAGRSWHVPTGSLSWIGWASRERPSPVYGEFDATGVHQYSEGRIIFKTRASADNEDIAITLDTLTGLLGVADNFWGEQLTGISIPPRLSVSATIFAEDVEASLKADEQESIDTLLAIGHTASVGDAVPEWALERVGLVMSDLAELVPALVYLFESRKEFHFVGDSITMVQNEPGAISPSPIVAIGMETAFHNAYKAMEALLGGEPPKNIVKLRERLESRSINPDQVAGFAGLREDMLARVIRLQATRDKRSAHAGRTGISARSITYFELMDAQYAAATAIKWRIEALREEGNACSG